MKVKMYIYLFVTIVIFVLSSVIFIQSSRMNDLKERLSISSSNEKALLFNNSALKNESRALQFTIDQLNYLNDSITTKMIEVKEELKIKDNSLKQMQYLLSEAQRKDTVIFRDTLFKDTSVSIDTLIGDRWYYTRLGLKYPDIVTIEPKFVSEKYIMVSCKKETIRPPKKCFIARWFQKRHKIVEVEVVEKNPYIINKQQRFIEIIQ